MEIMDKARHLLACLVIVESSRERMRLITALAEMQGISKLDLLKEALLEHIKRSPGETSNSILHKMIYNVSIKGE